MSDNLDIISDAALNEVFAVEVAALTEIRDSTRWEMTDPPDDPIVRVGRDDNGGKNAVKDFSTDANAVLPWLEKQRALNFNVAAAMGTRITTGVVWSVRLIDLRDNQMMQGEAPTFARAVCIALIRAKRAAK